MCSPNAVRVGSVVVWTGMAPSSNALAPPRRPRTASGPLSDDYNPSLQLLAGIFARKGERQRYDDTHPLNLLWNAFNAHTQHRPTRRRLVREKTSSQLGETARVVSISVSFVFVRGRPPATARLFRCRSRTVPTGDEHCTKV